MVVIKFVGAIPLTDLNFLTGLNSSEYYSVLVVFKRFLDVVNITEVLCFMVLLETVFLTCPTGLLELMGLSHVMVLQVQYASYVASSPRNK